MKSLLLVITYLLPFYPQQQGISKYQSLAEQSPLAAYSDEWNDEEFEECNTAAGVDYLTKKEKEIIYILNLVRSYPELFSTTVLKKYPEMTGKRYLLNDQYYFHSLVKTLESLEQQALLFADNKCYNSAACHAERSGKLGYVGHERKSASCKAVKNYGGECCEYGNTSPLEIVMALLIDRGVPNLGHRKILLGDYDKVGVSIKPHKTYRYNTVIDVQ